MDQFTKKKHWKTRVKSKEVVTSQIIDREVIILGISGGGVQRFRKSMETKTNGVLKNKNLI